MHKNIFFLLAVLFCVEFSYGQDSISLNQPKANFKFDLKSAVLPSIFIGYGIVSLNSPTLIDINKSYNNDIAVKNPANKTTIDNYLDYSPGFLALGLNAFGLKGAHTLKQSAIIYAITNLTVTAVVFPAKIITNEERPDHSSFRSFPSGHTSAAFASAEFSRLEYKNHPWVGIAGYTMAAATGYLRMYNNKHWFGDVVAGAGVGILSAKFSYWLFEKLKANKIKNKNANLIF